MKIYRHKKDKKLYNIYLCKPPMVLGYHYEAKPYNRIGKAIKLTAFGKYRLEEFEVVGER